MQLPAECVLSGQVRDASGAAVAGVVVRIGGLQEFGRCSTVTDAQGRVLTDAGRVELNAAIHVNLRDGRLDATVTQIHRTQIPHPPED